MQTGGDDMEYTIKQLANLSGVSTRTLRYYDEIDLLKPKRIGENGYRIYETEQIDTLEQILCYRSLGVSLEEISRLLSATNTEKEQVLQRHLIALSERKSQIELFIENVSKTILLLKGDIIMTDEEKFCCGWGIGRNAYFYTKCPCGRACGYAVQKHAFRAVGRGRADGGGCPCVSVSG